MASGLTRCTRCVDEPPKALSRVVARVAYQWPWTTLITEFKFNGQPAWGKTLAGLMTESPDVQSLIDTADGLLPIPLSRNRLLERGYNQAWELTRHLARAAGKPADATLLIRRDTDRLQHELSLDERRQHARRAFALHPLAAGTLAGGHWLLVDDVMTTGATLEAAAQQLLNGGAAQVSAVVFARTPAPQRDGDTSSADLAFTHGVE